MHNYYGGAGSDHGSEISYQRAPTKAYSVGGNQRFIGGPGNALSP